MIKNPKLIICNYFDELVRQIDIFVENVISVGQTTSDSSPSTNTTTSANTDSIASVSIDSITTSQKAIQEIYFKHNQMQQVLTAATKHHVDTNAPFENIAHDLWRLDENRITSNVDHVYSFISEVLAANEDVKKDDYYNIMRDKMLGELDRGQELAFKICKSSYSNIDELYEHVFANNYYLLVKAQNRLLLMVFDFYLDQNIVAYFKNVEVLANLYGEITWEPQTYTLYSFLAAEIHNIIYNRRLIQRTLVIIPIKRNIHLVKKVFNAHTDRENIELDLSAEVNIESVNLAFKIQPRFLGFHFPKSIVLNLHSGVREVVVEGLDDLNVFYMKNTIHVRSFSCIDIFPKLRVSKDVAKWFPNLEILHVSYSPKYPSWRYNDLSTNLCIRDFKNLRYLSIDYMGLDNFLNIDFSHPNVEILKLHFFCAIFSDDIIEYTSIFKMNKLNFPNLHTFNFSALIEDSYLLDALLKDMPQLVNLGLCVGFIGRNRTVRDDLSIIGPPLNSLRNLRCNNDLNLVKSYLRNSIQNIESLYLDRLMTSDLRLTEFYSLQKCVCLFQENNNVSINWPLNITEIDITHLYNITVDFFKMDYFKSPKLKTLSIRATEIIILSTGIRYIKKDYPSSYTTFSKMEI